MTISDEDFRRWCKNPHADSVLSFELDYVAEEDGLPVTRTLYVSDKPYRRSDNRYRAIIQDVSDFDKGLGGDRFGVYASSYGRLLLRSPDGEHDDILDFAMDGSEWRCRLGDTAWPITDHRIMDVGTIARVSSANISDIAIELQDAGLLLNKSIGGSVLIGGTGPNADKPRSFNFGLVRQVECFLVDQSANLWSHSDTGDNTIAIDVQVRLESVGFTDNGDGTITLDATPPRSGVVTANVLALPPDADPSETWRHLTSDAMDVAVGLRSGLIAEDRYAGPHATFTVGDDQDFPLGFNVTDTQKTPDFLTALCASGLCSWAFNRFNQFTYLRVRPNDLATLPVVPFDIRKDDIDADVDPEIEHELPKYYRLRGYCDKNWKLTDDVAGDVIDSDEYTQKTRVGLAVEQDDAVGETYADKPENYDKSMVQSPMLETWFSGDDNDDDNREHFKGTYLEVARANGLPWLETVKQVRVGMEFFDKELGDVARLTFDRWGYDEGALTQVIRIRKLHTARKIEFTLLRRRLSTPYPEGWERVTTGDDADTESSFIFDSEAPPTVVPPLPGPPGLPGIPPIHEFMGVSWMRSDFAPPWEFHWTNFVSALDTTDIDATLSNTSLDNVVINIQLGGPIANWKALSSSTTDLRGSMGDSAGEYRPTNALKLVNHQPDYDSFTADDLSGIPAYANILSFVTGTDLDPSAADMSGLIQFKGAAVTGEFGTDWECETTTDEIWIDFYYSTNPDSSNTLRGYPKHWWFRNNETRVTSAGANIEEWRCGFMSITDDVNDPLFDGSTMRLGVWAKKNGSNYDVKTIHNGIVINTQSIAGTQVTLAEIDLDGLNPPTTVPDTGDKEYWPSVQFVTNSASFNTGWSFDYRLTSMEDCKYTEYVKPALTNAVPITMQFGCFAITDPGYLL